MQNRQSAGKSFAYILGTYLSDGCITYERKVIVLRLEVMDEEYAIRFYNCLQDYGATLIRFYKIENPRYKQGFSFFVTCRDKELCHKLANETNNKSIIPEYVYNWSNEEQVEFVAAIMDGEGSVSERKKIMRNGLPSFQMQVTMDIEMLKQLNRLFHKLGIKTGKYNIKPQVINVVVGRLSLNINSWVDTGCYFYIQRKQDKVEKYIRNTNPNDYTLDTVM